MLTRLLRPELLRLTAGVHTQPLHSLAGSVFSSTPGITAPASALLGEPAFRSLSVPGEGPLKWSSSLWGGRSPWRGLGPAQAWGQEVGQGPRVSACLWPSRHGVCWHTAPDPGPTLTQAAVSSLRPGRFPFLQQGDDIWLPTGHSCTRENMGVECDVGATALGPLPVWWEGGWGAQRERVGGRGPLENEEEALAGTAGSSSFLTPEPTGFPTRWRRGLRLVIKPLRRLPTPALAALHPKPLLRQLLPESVYQQGLCSFSFLSFPSAPRAGPLSTTKPGGASLRPESQPLPCPGRWLHLQRHFCVTCAHCAPVTAPGR